MSITKGLKQLLKTPYARALLGEAERGISNFPSAKLKVFDEAQAKEIAGRQRAVTGALKGANQFNIPGRGDVRVRSKDAKTGRLAVEDQATKTKADTKRAVGEARGSKENLKVMKAKAKELSKDPMHKKLFGKEKSIAEHNLALQRGGTNDDMYVSDPMFRKFKDAVERKLYQSKKYKGYIVLNDPDTPGGLRIIREKDYVEGGDARDMRGITIDDMEQLQEALEALSKYK